MDKARVLSKPFSETTTWSYDAGSNTSQVTYGNGAKTIYSLDAANQVASVQHQKSTNVVIWTLQYSYDNFRTRAPAARHHHWCPDITDVMRSRPNC